MQGRRRSRRAFGVDGSGKVAGGEEEPSKRVQKVDSEVALNDLHAKPRKPFPCHSRLLV